MYGTVQPFITEDQTQHFNTHYQALRNLLFGLLDSPVKSTHHIGGTAHFQYPTEPIIDILVGVDNLHDITSLDEKRLNYAGFYRLHHPYKKKVVMAKFNNLIDLKQVARLHIIQNDSELYHQYKMMDDALASDHALAQIFAEKKAQLLQHVTTIRAYENGKQKIFDKLYQKYMKH